jgi:hypothetical protein
LKVENLQLETFNKYSMSAGRKRLLLILLGLAAVLWVAAIVLSPIMDGLPAATRADNTILSGIPFILTFIGIIIAFIDFIILMATVLNHKISDDLHRSVERILIGGIVFGVIGMFQPFALVLYTYGFILLLVATLGYIFWSHIVPRFNSARG